MTVTTNDTFQRLLAVIDVMGEKATLKASEMKEYESFIAAFPVSRLQSLSAEEYCVGKRGDTFCRWLERGLEPVMGRYMPGTSRGHVVYFKPDGSLYKNRLLSDLSDESAVSYTLRIHAAIAMADPFADAVWIDDDDQVFKRAGVEPRVTMGHGRKLRVLAAYHPDEVVPISSSAHVGHFLTAMGLPEVELPEESAPVARMIKLHEYFLLARQVHPDLSTRGFMLALYSQELGIAPEKPDEDSDGLVGDEPSPSYLLTWNPEHFTIGGDGEVAVGTEHRWTCHSKQPKVGDAVYLVRLGVDPKGIIAKGTVTGESHEAPHWRDATKRARYIRFRVDELRATAATGLLPMSLLNLALPQQKWSPQISGVGIPLEVDAVLQVLWDAGRDRHSLRQVGEWMTKLSAADSEAAKGLQRYKATTARAAALRTQPATLDQMTLDDLWRVPDNGVSHVGAGTLSNAEFAENLPMLRDLTAQILASPTSQTLLQVEANWKQAVAAKKLRMMNRAVIRRVFSAIGPRQFTTLLREQDCQKALALLKRQFELAAPEPAGADWVALNADLVACLRLGELDLDRPEENNTMLWRLLGSPAETAVAPALERSGMEEMQVVDEHPLAFLTPRNLILYGPPGSGKTYQTIEEAIGILAPELLEGEPNRASIKRRFDELAEAGRIVFTTFHQSFSYEDFVEGLRAETDEAGQLRYRVTDGVFKTLCEGPILPFAPGDEINGYRVLRCTEDILELKKPMGRELPLGMRLLKELCALVRANRITTEDIAQKQVFNKVPDTQLEPQIVTGYSNILPALADRMLLAGKRPTLPRVIIIDEINRGNVSRIFGELITLIEPSKRAGMPEALSVTLPYSKRIFSVPNNVHIIGTMNTADRSLVGIDIALRRRFEFRELQPRPDLLDDVSVAGISVGELLRVMNERIELLLDRDHRLGHAYFLHLRETDGVAELARVFRANILPLLQEYFFEDYERVRWVLNDHRKPTALQFLTAVEGGVSRLLGETVNLSGQSVRWVVNDAAFRLPEAYVGIIDAG